ncbi:GntR family transcriptional regulator [Micromonospora narathiwatensis]|uniref:Regulatory protein, gntR family n=1 Tax=Micromonospora narathiwatensis TaxID=299146 RepID=A0A1A9A1Q2_9ACTN|nr:GntR family transcriptional regulator [Micromonospora narathiwatensis]SBT50014.1 regulatory protein, gntR family [Micromonospora narathiwatensis]
MVDPLSPTPLYVQVANLVAKRIADGELEPLRPIPSESQLQQEYGVARGTVRQAVRLLRDRGLVMTVPQRGTYVAEKAGQ